jgi:hypothetical protein
LIVKQKPEGRQQLILILSRNSIRAALPPGQAAYILESLTLTDAIKRHMGVRHRSAGSGICAAPSSNS